MKFYISYFYQLRFFPINAIPLSTAVWDPKWYHNFQQQNHVWKDKRGIYNGLRAEPLHPDASCEGLCYGPEGCDAKPTYCRFLQRYYQQLCNLNFAEIVGRAERLAHKIQEKEGFCEEPIIILLVHEAPDNPCSERRIIKQWFHNNGYEISEWKK